MAQDSCETAVTTAIPETQIAKDDVTRGPIDLFRRLMSKDEETDDIPTKNSAGGQATNQDHQTSTKAEIEAWLEDLYNRSYDQYMDSILNSVQDKCGDALKMLATDPADDQPAECYLCRIRHSMLAYNLDDACIGDVSLKMATKSIREGYNINKVAVVMKRRFFPFDEVMLIMCNV